MYYISQFENQRTVIQGTRIEDAASSCDEYATYIVKIDIPTTVGSSFSKIYECNFIDINDSLQTQYVGATNLFEAYDICQQFEILQMLSIKFWAPATL